MSRFYVELKGGLHNGSATVGRRAHASYGAYATAASYQGAITSTPYVREDGKDCVRVVREAWEGSGGPRVVLYDGPFDMSEPYATDLV